MVGDKATRPALKRCLSRASKDLSDYIEFWLRFMGVGNVVSLFVEHTCDGRAIDMIEAGKRHAVELARKF
jgi:hypothetical protein